MYISWPHTEKDNHYICCECTFIAGECTEKEFLENSGVYLDAAHVAIKDGKAIIWIGGETPPWELTNKQLRGTPKYVKWRLSVFERDNFTCQKCGQRGGELNAHHIKYFSKHNNLRYDINNGITLCKDCHIKVHRKRGE